MVNVSFCSLFNSLHFYCHDRMTGWWLSNDIYFIAPSVWQSFISTWTILYEPTVLSDVPLCALWRLFTITCFLATDPGHHHTFPMPSDICLWWEILFNEQLVVRELICCRVFVVGWHLPPRNRWEGNNLNCFEILLIGQSFYHKLGLPIILNWLRYYYLS